MYNFAKQKDMDEMLDEFENICEYCSKVEEIKLYTTESKIQVYDCEDELGIVLYYLDGQAVAYIDDEDTLVLLKEKDNTKNMDIIEQITYDLQKKVYVEFRSNAEYFAKDINREMYRKNSFEKEHSLSIEEQEELDLKEWKREETRQAYAMNRGML